MNHLPDDESKPAQTLQEALTDPHGAQVTVPLEGKTQEQREALAEHLRQDDKAGFFEEAAAQEPGLSMSKAQFLSIAKALKDFMDTPRIVPNRADRRRMEREHRRRSR